MFKYQRDKFNLFGKVKPLENRPGDKYNTAFILDIIQVFQLVFIIYLQNIKSCLVLYNTAIGLTL